jgi:hypothetical protein
VGACTSTAGTNTAIVIPGNKSDLANSREGSGVKRWHGVRN